VARVFRSQSQAELRLRTEKTRREMATLEAQRKDLDRYFKQKDIATYTTAPLSSTPFSTRAASIGR